jgi:hypothetical protein
MVVEVTHLFKEISDKEALVHEPEIPSAVANINFELHYKMVMSENAACSDFANIS